MDIVLFRSDRHGRQRPRPRSICLGNTEEDTFSDKDASTHDDDDDDDASRDSIIGSSNLVNNNNIGLDRMVTCSTTSGNAGSLASHFTDAMLESGIKQEALNNSDSVDSMCSNENSATLPGAGTNCPSSLKDKDGPVTTEAVERKTR